MTWSRRLVGTKRQSLIVGGPGALEQLPLGAARAAEAGARLFLLTERNVHDAWGQAVADLLSSTGGVEDVLVVAPGETSKSVACLAECWEWLAKSGARRDDVLVALGGGVMGDLAGFTASTYQRGMSLWQIPTTLLAQVDSSVGGKTGINLGAGKNLVGSFYQPDFVATDPETLRTLPDKEYVGGLGEVVKYALLEGEEFLSLLESNADAMRRRDPEVMGTIVRRCVEYKAGVVEEDEFDQAGRAVLNLGHTTAHALEKSLGYGEIGHGQAVALGLLVAASLSERLLGLDPSVQSRIRELLLSLGLPVTVHLPSVEALLEAASRDKKVTAFSTGFVCLAALGAPVWGINASSSEFVNALEGIAE